jgi:hypothetical protein
MGYDRVQMTPEKVPEAVLILIYRRLVSRLEYLAFGQNLHTKKRIVPKTDISRPGT